MNLGNTANIMQLAYQYQNSIQRTPVRGNDFKNSLQEAKCANLSKTNAYTEELRSKYGNVMIMNVGKDQSSMDNLGMGTAGYGNVVIAPNILEQMANDPEKAAYYEEKIQHHFDTISETEAFMAAMGHVTTSSGVVIHEDGSATYYLSGEESPEKKAKFEAAQKAKREKKAEERRENIERNEKAAEERRRIAENQYRTHFMEQIRKTQIYDSSVGFCIVGQTQAVAPAVSAYEKAVSSIRSSII